ncbi:M16 family metallopeptidase [Roseimaritima ulvae]|uniref:Peptidase M16 inactive domain protein n=1 Tax=Roseimaritima ulvae TaxID=980254 RepID=A0A5B9QMV6_9BACT|nr:pitrilysin family protein [Roseimaritima ulvae]QEG38950.1 Peptidase M16 inactive domain protein [Roseimaritima ulvae]
MSSTADLPASPTLSHVLDNGLTVLGEPMPWLRTAAFSLCLPGGVQWESERHPGLAGLVCEMVQRGAGSRNSRDLVAAQDNLGMDRSAGVSTAHVSFGAAMPADSLLAALDLYADIVRRPHLPGDQLEDAQAMALQELHAIEDEPTQRVMTRLKSLHYGPVLGRSVYGTEAGLRSVSSNEIREFYTAHYQPAGAILAVAGNFQWQETLDKIVDLWGSWKPQPRPQDTPITDLPAVYEHIDHPSQQTHIAFAYPAVAYGHPDYFALRAGVGVLSDGMSSRLFDRVREQRGLCYSVSASCHSLRGVGGVFGYAGTTAERAQQTLDVTLAEIQAIAEGVDDDELRRLKVRVQSNLIMEQESSASRASSMVSDWFHLGRVMSAAELERRIESVRGDEVMAYWKQCPPQSFRIVTLGPQPLTVPA